MKHHEREFFVSMIRSGKVFINHNNLELEIRPITVEQNFKSCQIYKSAYDKAYSEEIMTEDDMDQWMLENELWTIHDNKKEESLKNDLERLKVEIYNNRDNTMMVNSIRKYLRAGELQLSTHLNKKYMYYQNTCEGIASTERLSWIIKNTTHFNDKIYNFDEISLQYVVDEWQSHFLSDTKCRELARNDPWKSLWIVRDKGNISLFSNPPNTELTHNQKSLLIWSQMYDNIQESMDCPNKDVIEDDDMLDGWFIVQHKKREKERNEREFENETKNEKIKNASEVYVVSNSQQQTDKINSLNNTQANIIKAQRLAAIKKFNSIEEQNLPDQRQNIQMQAARQGK
jgi:muconolactone delta-isomerase